MEIVVLDGYTANPGDLSWGALKQLGNVTVYDRTLPHQTVERIQNAQVVLTNKVMLTKQIIDAVANLRYIGVLATGYNVVDLAAAEQNGVTVTNIPAYSTPAVAQFVFALLLEICHHVYEQSKTVHAGGWTNDLSWSFQKYPLMELAGKTVGVVGYGRIGKKVAEIAQAFGMRVLVYTRSKIGQNNGVYQTTFENLLAESDVISLHCPLTKQTKEIINSETISKMKTGAILINTSRGGLVRENDLAQALQTGKLLAAGLDVVSYEPMREDNPLQKSPRCFITPHIAWAAKETRAQLIDIAVENIRAYLGGNPINTVTE